MFFGLLNPSLSLDYVYKWLPFWNPDNIFQILHNSLQGCQADVDIKFRQTFPLNNECVEHTFSNYSVDSSLITTICNSFPSSTKLMSNNKITFLYSEIVLRTVLRLIFKVEAIACCGYTFVIKFYNFFFIKLYKDFLIHICNIYTKISIIKHYNNVNYI